MSDSESIVACGFKLVISCSAGVRNVRKRKEVKKWLDVPSREIL